jgi:S-adenosylmethionine:tRNA ribosyltransferase-isomerase
MKVAEFDFDLPDHLIALRPVVPREVARLLEVKAEGLLRDAAVGDLPEILRAGDALVFNDTRVIPARLKGSRNRPGAMIIPVEATLHKRRGPSCWAAFMKPGRRLQTGDVVEFGDRLSAVVTSKGEGGEVDLEFSCAGAVLDQVIDEVGEMPLPPYIASKRAQDLQDRQDYQTIFARQDGSVAAPTAGLHLTAGLLQRLKDAGVSQHFVTLHVGAGTFLPVKVEDTRDHRMHAEWGVVSPDTAAALRDVRRNGGRIIAVGTTSLRLLESSALASGEISAFEGETDIFLTPGSKFQAVDGLMTNFHLPRSTLFMLVCALAGTAEMKNAYQHAIETGYRFYSYGDTSLLWRQS